MSSIIQILVQKYNENTEITTDPLVDTWFLMGSPVPIICIVASYLYFVLKLGPRLMASRNPFSLRPLLVAYNYTVLLLNLYIFLWAVAGGLLSHLIVEGCQPKQGKSEHIYTVYSFSWCYLMSKVVELVDTVFFVLRKKYNQVSFLHVYHHSSLALYTWAYLKYLPGEQAIFIMFINSLVHVALYFYYMVAAMGPKYQKYVWWKKHMTLMQMAQLILMVVYMIYILVSDCHLSRLLSILLGTNSLIMLGLFTNFYLKTYRKREAAD